MLARYYMMFIKQIFYPYYNKILTMINILKFYIILIFSFIITSQSYVFADNKSLNKDEIINKTREISQNIRCLVCRNQSIDESNSELAKDLRVLIKRKIIDGLSDKEIYNYLSNRYGDYILLNPPFKTNTILLWLLPFLILISGCFVMFKFLKK